MVMVYRCDFCGDEFDDEDQLATMQLLSAEGVVIADRDICDYCRDEPDVDRVAAVVGGMLGGGE
jgi:DNA-directed RNA polymerase subunit RPC12/RpoP